ncbi:MAG: cupin domain-containing protein, partial [Gemmatimonadales bacterium]|nr:cupin domain-containing protein [Gemmatimonadales bacterium]
ARGFHARFVHSERMTLAFWRVIDGATLPTHAHPHEQVTTVRAGWFELTIGDETQLLGPGHVAVVPSGVPHSGRAVTACELVDAFAPARDEYR